MKVLEFVFKLLYQFLSFEPGRFETLKDKAFKWQTEQESVPVEQQKWFHKLLKYDNEWWFQVGLAIFFLFAFKSIRSWLMETPNSGDDDDDDFDDDGDDDVRHMKTKKFSLPSFKL